MKKMLVIRNIDCRPTSSVEYVKITWQCLPYSKEWHDRLLENSECEEERFTDELIDSNSVFEFSWTRTEYEIIYGDASFIEGYIHGLNSMAYFPSMVHNLVNVYNVGDQLPPEVQPRSSE